MRLFQFLVISAVALSAMPAWASDFDGSKPLTCAPVTAMDCPRGEQCVAMLPEEIGAPTFMRLDFASKSVIGAKRTSEILLLDKSEGQLLLQGREMGFGWAMAINSVNGEMTVTFAEPEGAIVLFGSCTVT